MLRMYLAKSQGLSLHFASAAEQIFASEKQCPADFMYQEIHLTIASLFFFSFPFLLFPSHVLFIKCPTLHLWREREKVGLIPFADYIFFKE